MRPAPPSRTHHVSLTREGASNYALEWNRLSHREQQVVKLLADGLSFAEIAEQLGISRNTVRNTCLGVCRTLNLAGIAMLRETLGGGLLGPVPTAE